MTEQIATGTPVPDRNSALGARMEGTVNLTGKWFSVPLINKVGDYLNGELWQGGCISGLTLPDDFDFVLSLYPWGQYKLGPDTERVEVTMYDSLEQGFEQVEELADRVVSELLAGSKVLIHCQAGLNRSGLLAATTLKKLGVGGAEAINLLRESRGTDQVLCNTAFETHVRES